MLKNSKYSNNIHDNKVNIKYHDTTLTSEKYFRVIDLPSHFYLGKNGFRINANNENLVLDSSIYIDIVDTNGNPVYYEIIDSNTDDISKLVIVYIYNDTPPGECTIYIAGRACKDINGNDINYSNDKSSVNYYNNPNIFWSKKSIIISTEVNNKSVLFYTEPIVSAAEKKVSYKKFPGILTRESIISGDSLKQISYYPPTLSSQTGNDTTKTNTSSSNVSLASGTQSNTVNISKNEYNPIIQSHGFAFTNEMVNGIITIPNIDQVMGITTVTGIDYICKIVSIISSDKVYVTPEFTYNDIPKTKLIKLSNFELKYLTANESDIIQEFNESFIEFDFNNIEPVIGYVDNVRIAYKAFGSFGNFIDLGHYSISPFNYLYDENSVKITPYNVVEYPIGFNTNANDDFYNYWTLFSRKYIFIDSISSTFDVGIKFENTNVINDQEQVYDFSFKLNDTYSSTLLQLHPDSEYTLKMDVKFGPKIDESDVQQIDIFSNNIKVNIDTNDNKLTEPYEVNNHGFYIGSLTNKGTSLLIDNKIYFKTNEVVKLPLNPEFYVKNCKWIEFKNIRIETRSEPGYSPKQAKLHLPVNTIKNDTDLLFDIEYFNGNNVKGNYTTHLSGIRFDGVDTLDLIISSSISSSGSINTYVINQEEVTINQLNDLKQDGELKPGLIYKVTGVHEALYNDGDNKGTTVYLKALDETHIESEGYGEFYNPIYGDYNDLYNIWSPYEEVKLYDYDDPYFKFEKVLKHSSTSGEIVDTNEGLTCKLLTSKLLIKRDETSGSSKSWDNVTTFNGLETLSNSDGDVTNIKPISTYVSGSYSIFGGYYWKNIDNKIGNSPDGLYELDNSWEKIKFTESDYYKKVFDRIIYDVDNDIILLRHDLLNNNKVEYDIKYLDYLTSKGISNINPISAFQFGNPNVINNSIQNSLITNINNTNKEHSNNLLNTSLIYDIILIDGTFNDNNIDSSIIRYLVSYKSDILLNEFLDVNINTLKISNTTFESNFLKNNIILSNNLFDTSIFANNTILNGCTLSNNEFNIPINLSWLTMSNQCEISSSLSKALPNPINITGGVDFINNSISNESGLSLQLIATGSSTCSIEFKHDIINNSEITLTLLSDTTTPTFINGCYFTNTNINQDILGKETGLLDCTFTNTNIIGLFLDTIPTSSKIKYVNFERVDIENISINLGTVLYTDNVKTVYQQPNGQQKVRFYNDYGVLALANLTD